MTKRYRDFGAGKGVTAEPLSFKLHDEEFNCTPQVQGRLLLDLVAKSNNAEDPAIAAQIVTEFFEQVLTDESYVRFDALMHDKEKIVSVETLAEITGWLVEEYTDRPEEQPELS